MDHNLITAMAGVLGSWAGRSIFSSPEILSKMITSGDVEALGQLAGRIRARGERSGAPLSSSEAPAIDNQLERKISL